MRTLPALLLLTACGPTIQHLSSHLDASYDDIDTFTPTPTPDAGDPTKPPGSDAGAMEPAKLSDGGMYATPSTPDHVFCGQTPCDTTAQVCCLDAMGGPTCASASQGCGGHVSFKCDGTEDCGAGLCCLVPTMVDGGVLITTQCRSTCEMTAAQLCHRSSDCPSDRPACCQGADFPLGHCLPIDHAPAGDSCDVP